MKKKRSRSRSPPDPIPSDTLKSGEPLREIAAERLVLLDRKTGRARAIIETVEPADLDPLKGSGVRLRLLTPDGTDALVLEVDRHGKPRISVGHPDSGDSLILTRRELVAWRSGNEMLVLGSTADGGRLRLEDGSAYPIVIPSPGQPRKTEPPPRP